MTTNSKRHPTLHVLVDFPHNAVEPIARPDARYRIPADIIEAVEHCTKGDYQWNLLAGYEAWSGSTLKGAARDWNMNYLHSRYALLDRIQTTLASSGWTAATTLVRCPDNVARTALVLTNPKGVDLVWPWDWALS